MQSKSFDGNEVVESKWGYYCGGDFPPQTVGHSRLILSRTQRKERLQVRSTGAVPTEDPRA